MNPSTYTKNNLILHIQEMQAIVMMSTCMTKGWTKRRKRAGQNIPIKRTPQAQKQKTRAQKDRPRSI